MPIKRGQVVVFKPEWMDKGDENITFIAVDDEEKGRVTVEAQVDMSIRPRQVVPTDMIEAFFAISAHPAAVVSDQRTRLAIPWPKQLRTNERDHRGFPVPYIVLRDDAGRPHFTINDYEKLRRCIARSLCGLCGKRMTDGYWFIGGQRCFTEPTGAFVDPPSHAECAVYAIRVCPYLAAPSYARRIDGATFDRAAAPAHFVVTNSALNPDRPALFGLGRCTSFELITPGPGEIMFRTDRWTEIQYWRAGQRIEPETTDKEEL